MQETSYLWLDLIVYARATILYIQQSAIITKAYVKFQPNWLMVYK